MAGKDIDLCVFGASGFTGKFVSVEVAFHAKPKKLKIAFAGRSQARLAAVVDHVRQETGYTEGIELLTADSSCVSCPVS